MPTAAIAAALLLARSDDTEVQTLMATLLLVIGVVAAIFAAVGLTYARIRGED